MLLDIDFGRALAAWQAVLVRGPADVHAALAERGLLGAGGPR